MRRFSSSVGINSLPKFLYFNSSQSRPIRATAWWVQPRINLNAWPCDCCSRVCSSRIGLHAHQQTHRWQAIRRFSRRRSPSCIVAKRCVLEQMLLLSIDSLYRCRIWEIDWYQIEWPWPLFRGRL